MQTLQISENKAFELYPNSSPEFKTILEETFGKDFFQRKITDRVKTFEDACKFLGINPKSAGGVIIIDKALGNDSKSIDAYMKLIIIARALNEGWEPDWKDSSQYKYVPWFEANASGSGLSCDVFGHWPSSTGVGSRLCFKTRELAIYAAKQFEDIYNDYLTIQQTNHESQNGKNI